jgi:hypothetical protein
MGRRFLAAHGTGIFGIGHALTARARTEINLTPI